MGAVCLAYCPPSLSKEKGVNPAQKTTHPPSLFSGLFFWKKPYTVPVMVYLIFYLQLSTVRDGSRGGTGSSRPALSFFDSVLGQAGQGRNVEALMGKAKFFEAAGQMDKANEVLSALVVAFGQNGKQFPPPLLEKMKVELAVQDWDQAEDTANRVSWSMITYLALALDISKSLLLVNR